MQPKEIIQTIASPFRQFIRDESASGILLIISSAIAMIWANSSLSGSYFEIWETPVSISIGENSFSKPLLLWVNDGLMAIFFFVIGLEIKREVLEGELSSVRKASLPFMAAIGGMVIPVGLFLLLNWGQEGVEGWGIPMATDIAFSIGILSLLGDRIPLGMKVFLTAFAIVDDIGAVLVITFFYSHDIHWDALMISGGLMFILMVLNWVLSVKKIWPYLIIGIGVWYFLLRSGIHPTIAGVLIALTIPATNKIRFKTFADDVREYIQNLTQRKLEAEDLSGNLLPQKEIQTLQEIQTEVRQVQPPLQRLEFQLNEFVAFFVMPTFALANAGIALSDDPLQMVSGLSLNIAVGLVAGKLLGIFSFSWLSVKLGLADLPKNTGWTQMAGLALLGGIGFTMSLFIANLALEQRAVLAQAKLGILLGSTIAGALGFSLLWFSINKNKSADQIED